MICYLEQIKSYMLNLVSKLVTELSKIMKYHSLTDEGRIIQFCDRLNYFNEMYD